MSTSIEWAGETWNPIKAQRKSDGALGYHCVRYSAGCANCYAEAINFSKWQGLGTGLKYEIASAAQVDIFLDLETLRQPMRWAKERRIFVCSMTDAFANFVDSDRIAALFAMAALRPQHDFLFLTKRSTRAAHELLSAEFYMRVEHAAYAILGVDLNVGREPFSNCWMGFSAEDQKTLSMRWPAMRAIADAGWFVWCSAEPLLGRMQFDLAGEHAGLGWAVVGGESGRRARHCYMAHIDAIVEEFAAASRPLFVKQIGSKPIGPASGFKPNHPKGGDPDEWPAKLNVRQFPDRESQP